MNPTNILIIAFVCVTIGFLAGLLVSNMRSEPKPVPALPDGANKPTGPCLEVAQLVREAGGGSLLVHLETKYYRSPGELNPTQRQQMEELTLELGRWLVQTPTKGKPALPTPPASENSAAAAVEMEPVKEGSVNGEPVNEAPIYEIPVYETVAKETMVAAMAGSAPTAGAPHPEAAPATASPPPPPAAARPAPAQKITVMSIVNQINDILQENVVGTEFEKRGIRLVELPNRGVAVQVGLGTFPDIDSVPEPEIRSLIRAAVSEWELKAK